MVFLLATGGHGEAPVASVLLALAFVMVGAKLAGEITLMVLATTLATPPLLLWSLRRSGNAHPHEAAG